MSSMSQSLIFSSLYWLALLHCLSLDRSVRVVQFFLPAFDFFPFLLELVTTIPRGFFCIEMMLFYYLFESCSETTYSGRHIHLHDIILTILASLFVVTHFLSLNKHISDLSILFLSWLPYFLIVSFFQSLKV